MARVAGPVNLNPGRDIAGQMTLDHQCVQRLQYELGKLFLHCEGEHLSFFVGLPGSRSPAGHYPYMGGLWLD